jgi:hypothetical protein
MMLFWVQCHVDLSVDAVISEKHTVSSFSSGDGRRCVSLECWHQPALKPRRTVSSVLDFLPEVDLCPLVKITIVTVLTKVTMVTWIWSTKTLITYFDLILAFDKVHNLLVKLNNSGVFLFYINPLKLGGN